MAFDTSLINGVTYAANQAANVNGYTNNGNGTYTLDGSTYGGSLQDYWGPFPSGNVASVTLFSYNATLAPGIITYNLTYQDGTVVHDFGADVLGWGPHSLLVEVLDGFVPVNQAAGTYVGTLDPANVFWFSSSDISFNANGGNGPTFPVTFGTSGPFSFAAVPEPASYALMLVALFAVMIVKAPGIRRLFNLTA